MIFNFDAFVTNLHKTDPDKISLDQLKELLYLGDDYSKDTPISTGKRLVLDQISFWGKKSGGDGQPYNDANISYSQKIATGVNIWVADNLKGKSSIFKIIKFALTGRNKIKSNIKKWIHHILLTFSINERNYTIYLDTEKSLKGTLFNGTINDIGLIGLHSDDVIFTATSETKYEKQIEDFFFNQFSYYSLKWTQKAPQKDRDELMEAGASWVTYFESIFLESRDSASLMFGAQSKKIFQMLLGLELTYPINRLTVEKEKLQFDKAKQQSYTEAQINKQRKDAANLQARLKIIDEELAALSVNDAPIDTNKLILEYETLIQQIQAHNNEILAIEGRLRLAKTKLSDVDTKREKRLTEIHRINREIQKTDRRITDLEEFMQIGIFFSNLDIKQCPSCDHTVTEQKKANAAHSKTCSLCNDPILEDEGIDKGEYDSKISNLKIIKANLVKDLTVLNQDNVQERYETAYNDIIVIEQEKAGLKSIDPLNERLREVNEQLEIERARPKPNKAKNDELIAERAVVLYRLQQSEPENIENTEDAEIKINFLTTAIEELNNQRFQLSDKVLKRLADLMLEEIQQLGLTSITEVVITQNFDIKYNQDGELIGFDDIAEGEQLRAKIAFYLSLIQLDVEYNFGRHTRFLIIDSPAKEEADSKYMEGLSTVLQAIDDRFGDKLQILIGTAERTLTDIVTNQYVTPADQYVF